MEDPTSKFWEAPIDLVSVKEYISAPVIPLQPNATVAEALALVAKTGHQGFPVISDGKMVGMITCGDLILAKQDQRIMALMTTNLVSAKPDDDIVSVAGVMAYNHIHHLPII
ncbi:MAG: CBS domain-containing protein, partial [Halobacteriota archaeon]